MNEKKINKSVDCFCENVAQLIQSIKVRGVSFSKLKKPNNKKPIYNHYKKSDRYYDNTKED